MGGSIRFQPREGISLVEAIVAIVLLTVIVTALATHLFLAARRNVVVANDANRLALIAREVDRLTALPFDLLEDATWRTTNAQWYEVEDPPYPHRRKVLVEEAQDGSALEVRLIIEQSVPVQRVDTILLIRPVEFAGNPFNNLP